MRAVVTGAGARVGRAIAVALAGAGFEVAIHHRSNRGGAEETLAACEAAGGGGWLVQGDLAKVEDVRAMLDAVRARWDTLDLLVNNASLFTPAPLEELSLAHWDTMLALHARAPMLLAQGLLPQLRAGGSAARREPGEGGLVVNIVDIGAERPIPNHLAYTVSKGALLALTKALAVELAPVVRCVGVSPGQVAWPPDYDEAKRDRIASRIPMGRVGTPEDVASLVRYLATDAPYLNGIVVPVDGGLANRY